MQKRNNLVNNDDVNKMHFRNEMEKNNLETQLPSILNNREKKKVKANYYKKKRDQAASSVYEDDQGNIVIRGDY